MEQEAGDARREARDAGDAAPGARDAAPGARDASTGARDASTGPRDASTGARDASTRPRDASARPRDASAGPRDADREERATRAPASFGNVGEHHWSRARRDANPEALEYYRSRELAPGVAEGGSSRNFYCMDCDGVIAHDWPGERCPHCHAALAGMSKRYFNWVEINEPAASDARALLPFLIGGLLLLALVLVLSLRLLT